MAQPQAAPPQTYLHTIPSVHQSNAGVPPILGALDLNRSIQAGGPIDSQNLAHAKFIAKSLRTTHDFSQDNRVTAAVAESAELRVAAVEAAHVMAVYMPVNLAQALQNINDQLALMNQRFDAVNQRFDAVNQRLDAVDQRLDDGLLQINQRLDLVLAISRNNTFISRNRHHSIPRDFQPLLKTIDGNGLVLAQAIYGNNMAVQNLLVEPAQVPAVGTAPPNFSNNYSAYRRADIISLIIFYNQDFQIVVGDNVEECVTKFQRFLTTY